MNLHPNQDLIQMKNLLKKIQITKMFITIVIKEFITMYYYSIEKLNIKKIQLLLKGKKFPGINLMQIIYTVRNLINL